MIRQVQPTFLQTQGLTIDAVFATLNDIPGWEFKPPYLLLLIEFARQRAAFTNI